MGSKARPLFDLLKKRQPFEWGLSQEESFRLLKQRLTSPPVLALPMDEGKYVLDTDCSDFAAGAVLQQEQNGELRVTAYASRVLNGAERNYSTTRKETTAAVYGLKQFRQYLLGRRFTLRTDHAALTNLLKTPEVVGQQARYLDFLGQFTFDIVHRNGSKHQNSDGLSRRPAREEHDEGIPWTNSIQEGTATSKRNVPQNYDETIFCEKEICGSDQEGNGSGKRFSSGILPSSAENVGRIEAKNFIPEDESMALDLENIRHEQSIDSDLSPIMTWKQASESSPPWSEVCGASEDTRELWAQWESLTIIDSTLYRRFEDVKKGCRYLQIVLPRAVRDAFIRHCHRGQTGGHMGVRKTQEQVARRAYFCHWKRRVQEICRQCDECSRYSRGNPPHRGPMQIHEAGSPMDRLAIDLTGPHPRSSQGHVYILTAIDTFSRFLIAVPIRNKTAKTVATALYRFVFTKFGTSREILSDLGLEFNNDILRQMCELFGIRKLRTTAYHPECNAKVERSHRTLNSILAKAVAENQRNWHEVLDLVVAAYNATSHDSTKFSPNYLMYGRETNMPIDLIACAPNVETEETTDEYVEQLRHNLIVAYNCVRRNTKKAAERQKRYYDAKVRGVEFTAGELVLVYYPRTHKSRSKKWTSRYVGPCMIVRRINAVNYVIKKSPKSQESVIHVA